MGLRLPNLLGSSFSFCFPRKQKRSLMGLATGKGGSWAHMDIKDPHFLPWKGQKKRPLRTPPPYSRMEMQKWDLAKNCKVVEPLIQALSPGT